MSDTPVVPGRGWGVPDYMYIPLQKKGNCNPLRYNQKYCNLIIDIYIFKLDDYFEDYL